MWPTVEGVAAGTERIEQAGSEREPVGPARVASTLWTPDEGDHQGLLPLPGHRAGRRGRLLRPAVAAAAGPRPGRRRSATSASGSATDVVAEVQDRILDGSPRRLHLRQSSTTSSSRPCATSSRRPLRPRLDRLPDRPVVRLAGPQRLHRHHARSCTGSAACAASSAPGCCRSACTSCVLLVGIVVIPLVLAGPTLLGKVLPEQVDFLNSLYWPVATLLSVVSLTSLYHVSVPVRTPWRRDLPGRCSTIVDLVPRQLRGPLDHRQESSAAPRSTARWPRRSCCSSGCTCISIAVLIGAALNAAVETVWPRREITEARREPACRRRPRSSPNPGMDTGEVELPPNRPPGKNPLARGSRTVASLAVNPSATHPREEAHDRRRPRLPAPPRCPLTSLPLPGTGTFHSLEGPTAVVSHRSHLT